MWLPHPDHSTSLTKPDRTSFPCGLLLSAISRPPPQCREHPPRLDPGSPRESDIRRVRDRKSTRLNSSHANISYAVFCLKKKKKKKYGDTDTINTRQTEGSDLAKTRG